MTSPIAITRSNTVLYCRAWADTVDFYGDVFGLEATFSNDWFVEYAIGDGSHLSIANADRATIPAAAGAAVTLSWQVDDLENARRALIGRGAEPGPTHRRWGALALHVFDPEGNRIELWTQP